MIEILANVLVCIAIVVAMFGLMMFCLWWFIPQIDRVGDWFMATLDRRSDKNRRSQ